MSILYLFIMNDHEIKTLEKTITCLMMIYYESNISHLNVH